MKFSKYFDSTDDTALYSGKYAIPYLALGLVGESGEATEVIKKELRHGRDPHDMAEEKHTALKLELGDVMWYWCRLITEMGYDPREIFQMNYDKLHERHNIPKESI